MSTLLTTSILKIAAFSNGNDGGNPAGGWLGDVMPDEGEMRKAAAEIGFSETIFAVPDDSIAGENSHSGWRVRYFSPESEVPFCGHATIALGTALAMKKGNGTFSLKLNHALISVEGRIDGKAYRAALQSPPTSSEAPNAETLSEALSLFSLSIGDLDERLPPALIYAGASHLVLALKDRARLSEMSYDLERGKIFMAEQNLVTISLIHAQTDQLFHARNAFASGGVYEDPATGPAAAALGGYLRDIAWPHGGAIDIFQGEDMGVPSHLGVEIGSEPGSSVRVSGTARLI